MNNHLVEIDGKYPWGISPFSFGMLALIWALFCLIWWLIASVSGHGSLLGSFLFALVPEAGLAIYELLRAKKYGWIVAPILNTMQSAGMIEESKPIHRTLFGYNKVKSAPIFYLDNWKNKGYLLTFKPNGCRNANLDILPILQQELLGYEVIPVGRLGKQYVVRYRRDRGPVIDDSFFY